MAGKYQKVTISHPNHREDTVVIATSTDECYKIIGNQVLGFKNNWSFDQPLVFVYTLQPGDAAFIGVSDDDEALIQKIADLNEEDLELIRNFMVTANIGQ